MFVTIVQHGTFEREFLAYVRERFTGMFSERDVERTYNDYHSVVNIKAKFDNSDFYIYMLIAPTFSPTSNGLSLVVEFDQSKIFVTVYYNVDECGYLVRCYCV
jgi:hypothetical protein